MVILIGINNVRYFYPRSPCGERHGIQSGAQQATAISIHALLAESDGFYADMMALTAISIHALLAESDPCATTQAL